MAKGFTEASKVSYDIDSGIPRGTMYHIACKSWCTSTGSMMPLSFKFEGDDGRMIVVNNLKINYCEDKNYSGIPSKEYGVEAVVGGMIRTFKLICYLEQCKWVLLI